MSILYQNKTLSSQQNQPRMETYKEKATVSFSSKDQRFSPKVNKSPGPGAYDQKTSNFTLHTYHQSKDRSDHGPSIRKEHQWIWGSDRTSYLQNSRTVLGPGAYNINEMHQAVVSNNMSSSWGKSERFIYKDDKKSERQLPGPGAYDSKALTQGNKNNLGSVFRSKSPKTYLEKLMPGEHQVKRQNSQTAIFDNPEHSRFEENSREKPVVKKSPNKSSPVFASKAPRVGIAINTDSNELVGPATYDYPDPHKQKTKQKLPKIITVKSDERAQKIVKKPAPTLPGPGDYEPNIETIQKQSNRKKIAIDRSVRFQQKLQARPGPGHYMQNKYVFATELDRMKKLSPQKPCFNSSSGRSKPELSSAEVPFGKYNVDHFDMQYRLKKKQEHIDKLKIMDVSLPAFNTKSKK